MTGFSKRTATTWLDMDVTSGATPADLLNSEVTVGASDLTDASRLTAWGDFINNSAVAYQPPRPPRPEIIPVKEGAHPVGTKPLQALKQPEYAAFEEQIELDERRQKKYDDLVRRVAADHGFPLSAWASSGYQVGDPPPPSGD